MSQKPLKTTAAPNDPQHRSFQTIILKAAEADPQTGIIEAIVSVYGNIDRGNDRCNFGMFALSIARKLPKGVWMHDWTQPIAKTLESRELGPGDALLPPQLAQLGGLYIKGAFNLDTQRGREAYSDIKFGIVDEFSIGFFTEEESYDPRTGVRDLLQGELIEWSPVLVGMNQATHLLSVKGALAPREDFMENEETPTAPLSETKGLWEQSKAEAEATDWEVWYDFTGALRDAIGDLIQGSETGTLADPLAELGAILSGFSADVYAMVAPALMPITTDDGAAVETMSAKRILAKAFLLDVRLKMGAKHSTDTKAHGDAVHVALHKCLTEMAAMSLGCANCKDVDPGDDELDKSAGATEADTKGAAGATLGRAVIEITADMPDVKAQLDAAHKAVTDLNTKLDAAEKSAKAAQTDAEQWKACALLAQATLDRFAKAPLDLNPVP